MTDPRTPFANMTDNEIERALTDLGHHLAFPPTPDLSAAVREAIESRPVATNSRINRIAARRVLAAAALVLLTLAIGLVLSRGFRSAVADVFGIRGVQITIERGDSRTPTTGPTATPIGSSLLLGERLSLSDARQLAPFPIGVPTALGDPDEVYLRHLTDGNVIISLLYTPRPDLPTTAETGVGALIMQFRTDQPIGYIGKQVSEGYQLSITTVNGHDAIWIEGAHDLTLISDPSRGCCNNTSRSAGNVLLWEIDGQTFRFESALTKEQAIAIAESVTFPAATPTP